MSSIILEAKSLTKEYKQTLALDHINLQIKKGKIPINNLRLSRNKYNNKNDYYSCEFYFNNCFINLGKDKVSKKSLL